ncbi:ATP-binding protein [Streptomyces flavofungini]|uniref:ATP-binding protein n=1 Tax=Streptomyces flavofungini TaxID=68200 RepID=UPI0034DDFEDB
MEAGPESGGEDEARPHTLIQASHALDGQEGCIAEARHFAAGFLAKARTEHAVDVSPRAVDFTQLVVSELVTNAAKYAPGPVLMDLRVVGGMVEIVVWDSDPTVPEARVTDPGRIGQHGLEIVERVASSLTVHREAVGKRITATLPLTDAAPLSNA